MSEIDGSLRDLLFKRNFAEMTVDHVLREFDALVLQDLRILFHAAVERHADLKGPRKYVWIFDRGFVVQMIRSSGGDAFDNVQLIAMEIPRPVKPAQVVKIRAIDDERFTFPATVGPPHPAIGRRLRLLHVDGAERPRKLKDHHDVIRALDDLKWVRHIHGARNAREVALDLWITGHAVGEVVLFLLQGLRFVRKRAAFDDPYARRNGIRSAKLIERTGRGAVGFDVPIGLIYSLPNPIQVGLAILRSGRPVSRRLSRARRGTTGSLAKSHHGC